MNSDQSMSNALPTAVPVIDLGVLTTGETSAIPTVVEQVKFACENTGFFQVLGHGVDEGIIKQMLVASTAFFDLPAQTKDHIGQAGPMAGGLMYCPMMKETLSSSLGEAAPGDLKESLDFGPGFYGAHWPAQPAALHSVWLDYYAALSVLADRLRRLFALAIGVPEDYFEPLFDNHLSSLRVLDYPVREAPAAPGQLRAGAHSDYGFLTILRTSSGLSGLEIRDVNGVWTAVDSIPGGFVINLGDAMMRWTNDQWLSSVHRVTNPASGAQPSRRQSIAFFHNPNADARIDVFEHFCSEHNPKRYTSITYDDYALGKYRQTHGEDAPNPFAPG